MYKRQPQRLKDCDDAPLILFYKGNANLNQQRVINIVGTRHCPPYGEDLIHRFITDRKQLSPNVLSMSGLAYGGDIVAHQMCIRDRRMSFTKSSALVMSVAPLLRIRLLQPSLLSLIHISMVYTEFVSAEALVRSIKSTVSKLTISDEERPVGIQIYGRTTEEIGRAHV